MAHNTASAELEISRVHMMHTTTSSQGGDSSRSSLSLVSIWGCSLASSSATSHIGSAHCMIIFCLCMFSKSLLEMQYCLPMNIKRRGIFSFASSQVVGLKEQGRAARGDRNTPS